MKDATKGHQKKMGGGGGRGGGWGGGGGGGGEIGGVVGCGEVVWGGWMGGGGGVFGCLGGWERGGEVWVYVIPSEALCSSSSVQGQLEEICLAGETGSLGEVLTRRKKKWRGSQRAREERVNLLATSLLQ